MTARRRWCQHCDIDRARTSDGVCQACAVYRRKYGQLPSQTVLHRRMLRREDARLAARARGA